MRLNKICLLLLTLLIVLSSAGCSSDPPGKYSGRKTMHQYVFKGEDDFWYAQFRVNGEGRYTISKDGRIGFETWSDEDFRVIYKGALSDLSRAKNIKISYQQNGLGNAGSIQECYPEDGPFNKVFSIRSGSNGAIAGADATFTVTVVIDGHSQSFEMKNRTSAQDKLEFLMGKDPFEIRDEFKKWTGK